MHIANNLIREVILSVFWQLFERLIFVWTAGPKACCTRRRNVEWEECFQLHQARWFQTSFLISKFDGFHVLVSLLAFFECNSSRLKSILIRKIKDITSSEYEGYLHAFGNLQIIHDIVVDGENKYSTEMVVDRDDFLKLKDMAASILIGFMQTLYSTKSASATDYKVVFFSFGFKFWKTNPCIVKTEKETHGFGAAINFVDEGMSLNAFTRTEPSHQRVQKVSLHVAQCLAQPGDRVLIYKPHKLLAALNQLVKHVWNRRFCSQQEKESCRAFKNVNFVDVGCERKICRNVVPLLSWPCLHNKLLQRKPDPVCNFQGICGSLILFAELVSRNNGAKLNKILARYACATLNTQAPYIVVNPSLAEGEDRRIKSGEALLWNLLIKDCEVVHRTRVAMSIFGHGKVRRSVAQHANPIGAQKPRKVD